MAAAICGMFAAASVAGCGVYAVEKNDVWCEATESSGEPAGNYGAAAGNAMENTVMETSGIGAAEETAATETSGMGAAEETAASENSGMATAEEGMGLGNYGTAYAVEDTAGEDGPSAASGNSTARYGAAYVSGVSTEAERKQCSEAFRQYSQYGMVYDENKDELRYHGKLVRWFEDYYPVGEGMSGGLDFFNENGVADVHAVRDFGKVIKNGDGSVDPSGKLAGLELFSEQEFAARDIEAIKNPPITVAYASEGGAEPDKAEMESIASEYAPFGVTYNARKDQWYFHGEKVRYFRDILTSNGESLTGGKFSGSMRMLGNGDGTVDLETVRDFQKSDAEGNGTLTGVEKLSQEEFEKHSQEGIFQEQQGRDACQKQ